MANVSSNTITVVGLREDPATFAKKLDEAMTECRDRFEYSNYPYGQRWEARPSSLDGLPTQNRSNSCRKRRSSSLTSSSS